MALQLGKCSICDKKKLIRIIKSDKIVIKVCEDPDCCEAADNYIDNVHQSQYQIR